MLGQFFLEGNGTVEIDGDSPRSDAAGNEDRVACV
jgi:hypothetical protein